MVRMNKYLTATVILCCAIFAGSTAARADGRINANMQPMYDACMTRCARSDVLGNLTREGCLKGCAQMRRMFRLSGCSYRSFGRCFEDLEDIELNRDLLTEKYQNWCADHYKHIHKRQGCKDAVKVFMDNATYDNVCGRVFPPAPVAVLPVVPIAPASPVPLYEATPLPAGPVPVGPSLSAPLVRDTPKYSPRPPKKFAARTGKAADKDAPQNIALQKDAPMPGNETYPGYVPLDRRAETTTPAVNATAVHPALPPMPGAAGGNMNATAPKAAPLPQAAPVPVVVSPPAVIIPPVSGQTPAQPLPARTSPGETQAPSTVVVVPPTVVVQPPVLPAGPAAPTVPAVSAEQPGTVAPDSSPGHTEQPAVAPTLPPAAIGSPIPSAGISSVSGNTGESVPSDTLPEQNGPSRLNRSSPAVVQPYGLSGPATEVPLRVPVPGGPH